MGGGDKVKDCLRNVRLAQGFLTVRVDLPEKNLNRKMQKGDSTTVVRDIRTSFPSFQ